MRFNLNISIGILCCLLPLISSCNAERPSLPAPVLKIAEQNDTSFTVCWEKVEEADSYTFIFNGGTKRRTTDTSAFFSYLTTGEKYKFSVKANAQGGSKWSDSQYAAIEVTLEEFDASKALQQWVGSWTATSKTAIQWRFEVPAGGGNPIQFFFIDTTISADLHMEIAPAHSDILLIHGWSYLEYPAYAKLAEDRSSLDVYAGVEVDKENTSNPRWCSYIYVPEDDAFGNIAAQHPAYRITRNGKTATAFPLSGSLQGNKTYTVRHIGVYGYHEGFGVTLLGGIGILPLSLLADEITLIKE